jgi:hypothetical protein
VTIQLQPVEKPRPEDSGFLYGITIERNGIEAMGLSGIGATAALAQTTTEVGSASALAVARNRLGTPVVGLAIRGNRITGCLLNRFDRVLTDTAATQGLGGISLGMCEALSIVDNTIERNGVSGVNPVCGIFVAYSEDVEITHNRIVDNGVLTPGAARALTAGRRGGIVLNLVSNFNMLDASAVAAGETFNQRPAARIHENLVDQPVGVALFAIAFGPVQCTDNAFSSELSGPSAQERLAGTVYLFDLGGVNKAAAGVTLQRSSTVDAAETGTRAVNNANSVNAASGANAAAGGPTTTAGAAATRAPSLHAAPAALVPQRDAAVEQLFPAGNVMFNNNQSRTGQTNTSAVCHIVATLDDLAYQNNQSFSLRSGTLFANGFLYGNTLRAIGNRMSERGDGTLLSILSLGVRLNNTSLNQADHCIVANDMNPAMAEVKAGNQILNPSQLCASRSIVAGVLFKPHG